VNTNNCVKWRFIVPKKVEQINDHLFCTDTCVVYGHRTVSGIQSSPGSLHTSTASRSTSAAEARTRILLLSSSGSHRARSWVRSCFYSTRRTCCDSSNYTTCSHIFTLMTCRYKDSAGLEPQLSYKIV